MATRQEIEALIRQIAAEEGVDPNLAVAMARQESGLNPNAVGDNGDSVGLFQLNQHGMGAGMGDLRYDPQVNAHTALRSLAMTAQQHPGADAGTLAALSQRPADPQGYARSINGMLAGATGFPHTGSPFDPNAPSTAGGASVDNELTQEYTRQQTEAKARLDDAKRQLDAIALVRQYNADKGTKTDKWLADRNLSQSDLDAAKAVYDEVDPDNIATGGPQNLTRLRQDQQKAQADYDRASAALAKAQSTQPRAPSPSSTILNTDASDKFIIKRDPQTGQPLTNEDGSLQTIPNPNYRPPADTSASDRAASGLYGAQADEARARAAAEKTPQQVADESAAAIARDKSQAANYDAQAAQQQLANAAEQAKAKAWAEKVQPLIDAGADKDTINAAVAAAAGDVKSYVDVLNNQLQAQRDAETARADKAREEGTTAQLAETARANQAREAYDASVQAETARHNRESEANQEAQTRTSQVDTLNSALKGYQIATAPFQSAILAAASPLMDLHQAAQGLGLSPDHPIVQAVARAAGLSGQTGQGAPAAASPPAAPAPPAPIQSSSGNSFIDGLRGLAATPPSVSASAIPAPPPPVVPAENSFVAGLRGLADDQDPTQAGKINPFRAPALAA